MELTGKDDGSNYLPWYVVGLFLIASALCGSGMAVMPYYINSQFRLPMKFWLRVLYWMAMLTVPLEVATTFKSVVDMATYTKIDMAFKMLLIWKICLVAGINFVVNKQLAVVIQRYKVLTRQFDYGSRYGSFELKAHLFVEFDLQQSFDDVATRITAFQLQVQQLHPRNDDEAFALLTQSIDSINSSHSAKVTKVEANFLGRPSRRGYVARFG